MKKKILITNGRFPITLDLIRNLSGNENLVHIAETAKIHYCATSNATTKNHLIPSPRTHEKEYIKKISKIMKDEAIDLFIPCWEDVLVVARNLDAFEPGKVFTSDFNLIDSLHNKWKFMNLLKELGYETPQTKLVTSDKDINNFPFEDFYAKYCYSRAAEGTFYCRNKEQLKKRKISKDTPMIIQERIDAKQYCTFSICHNGEVKAHATYPVHYQSYNPNKTRGNYCLSFEEMDHKGVYDFVTSFIKKINYTGSIAFDVFEKDGQIIPLECNPRLTSGSSLLTSHVNLSDAFFNTNKEVLFPRKGAKKQLLLQSILFGSKSAIMNRSLKPFIKTLFSSKDIIFNVRDIKPFLFQPMIGMYQIFLCLKNKRNMISSYSHDIDYEG